MVWLDVASAWCAWLWCRARQARRVATSADLPGGTSCSRFRQRLGRVFAHKRARGVVRIAHRYPRAPPVELTLQFCCCVQFEALRRTQTTELWEHHEGKGSVNKYAMEACKYQSSCNLTKQIEAKKAKKSLNIIHIGNICKPRSKILAQLSGCAAPLHLPSRAVGRHVRSRVAPRCPKEMHLGACLSHRRWGNGSEIGGGAGSAR